MCVSGTMRISGEDEVQNPVVPKWGACLSGLAEHEGYRHHYLAHLVNEPTLSHSTSLYDVDGLCVVLGGFSRKDLLCRNQPSTPHLERRTVEINRAP